VKKLMFTILVAVVQLVFLFRSHLILPGLVMMLTMLGSPLSGNRTSIRTLRLTGLARLRLLRIQSPSPLEIGTKIIM